MAPDSTDFEFRLTLPPESRRDDVRTNVASSGVDTDLDLTSIQLLTRVSHGKAKYLMEACVWCLTECGHSNGIKMKLTHSSDIEHYGVIWPNENLDMAAIRRSYNEDDAIEAGAEAIAILVAVKRSGFTSVHRACRPNGIDYWLGHMDDNPNLPFQRAWRLEISGILRTPNPSAIAGRVKQKLRQIIPSDHLLPAYVVVVEFSEPLTTMVEKDAIRT